MPMPPRPSMRRTADGAIARHPALATLALLMVVADAALVAVHVVAVARGVPTLTLRIDSDRSYGELFEYLKLVWSLTLLGVAGLALRTARPIAWMPLLALLLVDNGWTLHERVGAAFVASVGVSQPIGELLFVVLAYPLAAAPAAIAMLRADGRIRSLGIRLAVCVAVLAGLGLGVDAIHHFFERDPVVQPVLAVLEDGGELVTFTALLLACAAALPWMQAPSAPRSAPA